MRKCDTCAVSLVGGAVKEHFASEGHKKKESIYKRLYGGEGKAAGETKSIKATAEKAVKQQTEGKSGEGKPVKKPKETAAKKPVQGAKVWRAKVAEEHKE